jgi:5-methylcytosine-specific restriction endonuclease McrA
VEGDPLTKHDHETFITRTHSIYTGQVKSYAERKDKNGRVTRYAKQIPYTLVEFRAWVLTKFQGKEDGACQCPYCGTWIDVANFQADHATPVGRGGSLGLDNLNACCERCNSIKDQLTVAEYLALRKFAAQLCQAAETNILRRLEVYVKQAINTQRLMNQRRKNARPSEVPATAGLQPGPDPSF